MIYASTHPLWPLTPGLKLHFTRHASKPYHAQKADVAARITVRDPIALTATIGQPAWQNYDVCPRNIS